MDRYVFIAIGFLVIWLVIDIWVSEACARRRRIEASKKGFRLELITNPFLHDARWKTAHDLYTSVSSLCSAVRNYSDQIQMNIECCNTLPGWGGVIEYYEHEVQKRRAELNAYILEHRAYFNDDVMQVLRLVKKTTWKRIALARALTVENWSEQMPRLRENIDGLFHTVNRDLVSKMNYLFLNEKGFPPHLVGN